MILYNITYGIDKETEAEWVGWMKDSHIPEILSTGFFETYKFYKVLTHEEENSVSYCIQFFTPSIIQFNQYLEQFAGHFINQQMSKFKDKHVAFNTLLEEV